MNPAGWLDGDVCVRLTLTLVHSLWQGTVVALLAGLAMLALRRASPGLRYGILVAALAVMAACVPVTFAVLDVPGVSAPPEGVSGVEPGLPAEVADPLSLGAPPPPLPVADAAVGPAHMLAEPALPVAVDEESRVPVAAAVEATDQPDSRWRRAAPYVAAAYLVGVLAMLGRLALGLGGGCRLRRRSQPVREEPLLTALGRQARALGLSLTPAVAYCREVALPTVVGILRPTILLPLSLASGLSPEQIEALLSHELAHIRRYDHLVNLVQRVIEALLFFHPAVWFISRGIRAERELCCDDLVVTTGGEAAAYADSLVRVAELSRPAVRKRRALAGATLHATGRASALGRRITRLLGDPSHERTRINRGWTVSLALVVVAALLGGFLLHSSVELPVDADARSATQPARPWKVRLASGATVELVGLAQYPSTGQQWWGPDGGRLAQPPYAEGPEEFDVKAERPAFEVAYRIAPSAEGGWSHNLEWLQGSGLAGPSGPWTVKPSGEPVPGSLFVAAFYPSKEQTTGIRIGVAGGAWKTVATGPVDRGLTRLTIAGDLSLSPPQRKGNDIHVIAVMAKSWQAYDWRLAFEDKAGKMHSMDGRGITALDSDDASRDRYEVVLAKARLSDMVRLRVEVRPYQYVTYRNVSLIPGRITAAVAVPDPGRAVALAPERTEAEGPTWGEAVGGIQLRLQADRARWNAKETAIFNLEIRNAGKRDFYHRAAGRIIYELEIDGRWGRKVTQMRDGLFTVPSEQTKKTTLSRSWPGSQPATQPPGLETPGRHTIRIALTGTFRKPGTGRDAQLIRAVSNPVEIEIRPAARIDALIDALGEGNGGDALTTLLKETQTADTAGKAVLFDRLAARLGSDQNAAVRSRCALCLGYFKGQAAKPLVQALRSDPDGSVRAMAARALGKAGGEKEIDDLYAAIHFERGRKDRRLGGRDVASFAVSAIGSIGGPRAAQALLRLWHDDKIRLDHSLVTMAETGQPAVLPVLEDTLRGVAEQHRDNAAYGLGILASRNRGDGKLLNHIRGLLREYLRDWDPDVRGNVARSLGFAGDASDIARLEPLLKDEHASIVSFSQGGAVKTREIHPVRDAAKDAIDRIKAALAKSVWGEAAEGVQVPLRAVLPSGVQVELIGVGEARGPRTELVARTGVWWRPDGGW